MTFEDLFRRASKAGFLATACGIAGLACALDVTAEVTERLWARLTWYAGAFPGAGQIPALVLAGVLLGVYQVARRRTRRAAARNGADR